MTQKDRIRIRNTGCNCVLVENGLVYVHINRVADPDPDPVGSGMFPRIRYFAGILIYFDCRVRVPRVRRVWSP